MQCPNCGSATAAGDAFCGQCGVNLAQARATCRQCGRVNAPGARFCTACGSRLDEPGASGEVPVVEAGPQPDPPAAPDPFDGQPAAAAATVPAAQEDRTEELPPSPPPPPPQPPPPPAPTVADTGVSVRPVALVGCGLAVVGVFLPWLQSLFDDVNGLDAPVQFLWDYRTTADSTLSLGLLVLVAAGAAALLAIAPKANDRLHLLRPLGLVVVVLGGVFVAQVVRAAADTGVSFTDIYGFGPIVSALGGVLIVVGK